MFERIAQVIADTINVDAADIYPEMVIQGKDGLDDLELARVILGVEKVFGVVIYDIDAAGFVTAGDLLAYVRQNRAEKEEEKKEGPIEIDEYFYSE